MEGELKRIALPYSKSKFIVMIVLVCCTGWSSDSVHGDEGEDGSCSIPCTQDAVCGRGERCPQSVRKAAERKVSMFKGNNFLCPDSEKGGCRYICLLLHVSVCSFEISLVAHIFSSIRARVMELYRKYVKHHDCIVVHLGFCLWMRLGITEL